MAKNPKYLSLYKQFLVTLIVVNFKQSQYTAT